MYDKERTLALINEARRLMAALKIETQEIGRVIDHAFDDEDLDLGARNSEAAEATLHRSRWWFWR
jgi:hypothetical protein